MNLNLTHKCNICGKRFATINGLSNHVIAVHNNQAIPKSITSSATRTGRRFRTRVVEANNANSRVMTAGAYAGQSTASAVQQLIGKRGGGDWAFAALDPCAEIPFSSASVKIPDQSIAMTVPLQLRDDFMISCPSGTTTTWDCMIISLPIPEQPLFYVTKKSEEARWTIAYDSTNIRSFPGMKYGMVLPNSNATPFEATTAGPDLGNCCNAFRVTKKGVSVLHNSSALTNEGFCWSGQISSPPSEAIHNIRDATDNILEYDYSENVLAKLPWDTDSLVSNCSNYSRTRARDGCYMASKFCQQTHTYRPCDWGKVQSGDGPQYTRFLQPTTLGFVNENGLTESTDTFHESGQLYVTSGTDNTQVGVMMFMGIDKAATLDVKMRMNIEASASPGSPWAFFMTKAPMPDSAALEEYFIIQNTLPDSYPERYNSLGALIPVLASAASQLVGWGIGKISGYLHDKYGKPRGKYVEESVD